MITPSHIVYGLASASGVTHYLKVKPSIVAVTIGAILPDLPAYVFFLIQGVLLQTPHEKLWDVLYFDSAWTPFLTLSHSFILWPVIAVFAFSLKRNFVAWLAASAILHTVMDFFVHTTDAYRIFWPLSDWKFISPVSYWNQAEYGGIVSGIDIVVVTILLMYLYRIATNKTLKFTLVGLGALYILFSFSHLTFIFGI